MPLEVRRLGRTITRWRDQIIAWHRCHVSNAPTEAVNNLVKRVKRVAFGMRRFRNSRLRALLYAGRPNWNLLDSLTPLKFPRVVMGPPERSDGSLRSKAGSRADSPEISTPTGVFVRKCRPRPGPSGPI